MPLVRPAPVAFITRMILSILIHLSFPHLAPFMQSLCFCYKLLRTLLTDSMRDRRAFILYRHGWLSWYRFILMWSGRYFPALTTNIIYILLFWWHNHNLICLLTYLSMFLLVSTCLYLYTHTRFQYLCGVNLYFLIYLNSNNERLAAWFQIKSTRHACDNSTNIIAPSSC